MTPDIASRTILLPAVLDLAAAEELSRTLVGRLTEGGIEIEGSAVERVATPCLQVLAAAAASARGQHHPFRLCRPSAALQAAISDLGLDAAIPFAE